MDLNLTAWRRGWQLMSMFFSGDEIATITERLKNIKINNVVLCSFENRFARSGGLAAVITNTLPYLKVANDIPSVILITPFHSRIIDATRLRSTSLSFNVPFNNKTICVEIFEYTADYEHPAHGSIKEYFLKAEGFFEAQNKLNDPYIYDHQNQERNAALQCENALFFCKAVPLALSALTIDRDIVFHLHEWQTALISLTAKEAMLNGLLKSCATVQTLHNSYDSAISWDMLANLIDGSRRKKIPGFPAAGMSVYQISLQLVDGPVTTVSEHFAEELTSDILQTEHYAPHLQGILKASGVFGINNGMFSAFDVEYTGHEGHTIDEVRKIKLKKRKDLLKILSSYKPAERFGDLTYKGKTISKLPDNIPIVFMSGRLDPTQKGYYVLLRALESFAEDEIKAVLTPLPVTASDLDYFYEIACKCKGNVTVFPSRLSTGYHELQTGATFGIMPSIYEPFGAAVEYMTSGTVNIGRGTGGLVNQIDGTCGFLYREDAVFYTTANIHSFIQSANIIQANKSNPWAQSMADSLSEMLRKAIDVYQNHPDDYYRMIISGFERAKQFTWEANAKKYYQIYKMATKT